MGIISGGIYKKCKKYYSKGKVFLNFLRVKSQKTGLILKVCVFFNWVVKKQNNIISPNFNNIGFKNR